MFKKHLKIFLKAQKTIIKGKPDHLFETAFATFIPTFQGYNKAKVEEYILLAYYKELRGMTALGKIHLCAIIYCSIKTVKKL